MSLGMGPIIQTDFLNLFYVFFDAGPSASFPSLNFPIHPLMIYENDLIVCPHLIHSAIESKIAHSHLKAFKLGIEEYQEKLPKPIPDCF